MTTIYRYFNLYLNAGVSMAPYIDVSQGDEDEVWTFSLFEENGTPYIPQTVSIIGTKADKNPITIAGTISDGKAVIVETAEMTSCAGIVICELNVDNNHGTANFKINVEPSALAGSVVSEPYIPLIQQAVDSANRIAQYGSPLKAFTTSDMTNTQAVYVWAGSTTASFTQGHWYAYNGSSWVDGGVYIANLSYATDENNDGHVVLHLGG